MSDKEVRWVFVGSVSAVVLGLLAGLYLPNFITSLSFLGKIFFNGLQLLIIPLIITSLSIAIVSLGDTRKFGRTVLSTVSFFGVTTVIAVTIGLVLDWIFKPGSDPMTGGLFAPAFLSQLRTYSLSAVADNLIPGNFPQAIMSGNYLGILVVTVLFGIVLAMNAERARPVIDVVRSMREIVFKLVNLLLLAAPIGILVMVGVTVAENSVSLGRFTSGLLGFSLVLMGGFLIHGLVILPLALKLFTDRSPVSYFKNMIPAFTTGFGTASSTAAMTVTYHCAIERNKVDERAGAFVLPLGAIINVDATAMYATMAVMFAARAFGVDLTFGQVAMMVAGSILFSFGLAGIPFGALFLTVLLFDLADFPPDAYAVIGLLLAVDWLFDRLRTTLNIWSDSVGVAVVANTFEFKTARRTARRSVARTSGRYGDRKDSPRRAAPRSSASTSGKPERKGRNTDSRPTRTERPERVRGRRSVESRPERPRTYQTSDSSVDRQTRSPEPVSPFEISADTPTPVDLNSPVPADSPPARTPRRAARSSSASRSAAPRTARKTSTARSKARSVSPDVEQTEQPVSFEMPKPPENLPFDSQPRVESKEASSSEAISERKDTASSPSTSHEDITEAIPDVSPEPTPENNGDEKRASAVIETSLSTNTAHDAREIDEVTVQGDEPKQTAFGRTKGRAKLAKKESDEPTSETDATIETPSSKEPEPDETVEKPHTPDEPSFGRGKKKRIR